MGAFQCLKCLLLGDVDVLNFSQISETNLKIRQARQETANVLTPEQVARLEGMIKSEQPNRSLYTYEGTLRLGHEELPLDPLQLLLRASHEMRSCFLARANVAYSDLQFRVLC